MKTKKHDKKRRCSVTKNLLHWEAMATRGEEMQGQFGIKSIMWLLCMAVNSIAVSMTVLQNKAIFLNVDRVIANCEFTGVSLQWCKAHKM